MMNTLLTGQPLAIADVVAVARAGQPVALSPAAEAAVAAGREWVERVIAGDAAVYGVNTGFGGLSKVRIAPAQQSALQHNLVRSHAAGVGELLDVAETRALMLLRANVLAKGYSGVRPQTLDLLVSLLNAGVHPAAAAKSAAPTTLVMRTMAHRRATFPTVPSRRSTEKSGNMAVRVCSVKSC